MIYLLVDWQVTMIVKKSKYKVIVPEVPRINGIVYDLPENDHCFIIVFSNESDDSREAFFLNLKYKSLGMLSYGRYKPIGLFGLALMDKITLLSDEETERNKKYGIGSLGDLDADIVETQNRVEVFLKGATKEAIEIDPAEKEYAEGLLIYKKKMILEK